jgi:hypothetical protein
MRVATIFTGVAACVVGGTQVANAQEVRPAGTQDIQGYGQAALPGWVYSGYITSAIACGNAGVDKPWLHVSTTNPQTNKITSLCFGNQGRSVSPRFVGARAECGGTNHGVLTGFKNSSSVYFKFGPGTTYAKLSWSHLNTVYIGSWTGTDQCPKAPNFGKNAG